MKFVAFTLIFWSLAICGQTVQTVEVKHPTVSDEGVPDEPASVCFLANGVRQCYTPDNDVNIGPFGLNPKAYPVALKPHLDAVMFAATAFGGGSGSKTRLALLMSKHGRLENLLPEINLSEQSEYRLLHEPAISDVPLLVVADYIWQDGEAHFSSHRFCISTYRFGTQLGTYVLQDQYITARKYADKETSRIIEQEKREIVSRLRRQVN